MAERGSRRGRTHDAEGARQAILEAAEAVFAEHGFDGARVDAIAAHAGYNKSLIFQYFDDKLTLYAAVIRRADDQTRDLQTRALAELMTTETVIDSEKLKTLFKTFIKAYFDYMADHPRFVQILNWEMAEGWQTYAKITSERDFQDLEDFSPPIQQAQQAGLLRNKLNPLIQLSFAVFLNHVFMGLIPFFQIYLPGYDPLTGEERERTREFLAEFIAEGMIAEAKK
jgi:TetR/AcrR family transcriptional regulator